jgi:hypothetical protein
MLIECRECATLDDYETASALARSNGGAIVGIASYDPVTMLISYTGAVPFTSFQRSAFDPEDAQLLLLRAGKQASRFVTEHTTDTFDRKAVYEGNPSVIGTFEL